MGYLPHIVLALAALGLAESGVTTELELPLGVLALGLGPYGLQALVRRELLRGHFRRGDVLRRVLDWWPPLAFALALMLLGWSASVERWTGVRPELLAWPHPVVFLSLAPLVYYTLLAIDARARLSGVVGIFGARRFHVRMFLTGLAPIAAWITVASAIGLSSTLRVNIEEVSAFGVLFAIVLFAFFITLLPWLVRHGWETRPLPPGEQREELDALARRVGFQCREILVWGTAHQMANAAVVGLGARQRVVLLSDMLLAHLPRRELLAVFAHETGHVQRRHVHVFLASAAALFLTADVGIGLAEGMGWFDGGNEFVAGGLVLAAFALWYVAFGWLSRRFELDADLFSSEATSDPEAMISALERVGGSHGRERSTWRHFSTQDRAAFLARAAQDPSVGLRLRALLRRIALSAAAITLAGVVAEAWLVADDFGAERLRVDLRLGDYAGAERRLDELDEPDVDLARRIGRARRLGEGVDAESLVEAAFAAFERGDEQAAVDYAELAVLRGADRERFDALRTGSR